MLSESIPFIQSDEITELYKAIATVQSKHVAFHASTANPHFKNKFAPYPEMLADFATWNNVDDTGLVFSCKPFLKGVKCTIIHTPSGQYESWYAMFPPELTKDLNAWKGANTSMGRLQLAGTLGMGSDPDVDNSDITLTPEVKKELKMYTLNNENEKPPTGLTEDQLKVWSARKWLNLLTKEGAPIQREVDVIKKAKAEGKWKTIEDLNKRYLLSQKTVDWVEKNL